MRCHVNPYAALSLSGKVYRSLKGETTLTDHSTRRHQINSLGINVAGIPFAMSSALSIQFERVLPWSEGSLLGAIGPVGFQCFRAFGAAASQRVNRSNHGCRVR